MEPRVAEVGDGIYQLTTYLPDMDFAVNQYLLIAEEPLLFHTGMRGLFPLVSEAVVRVMPIASRNASTRTCSTPILVSG